MNVWIILSIIAGVAVVLYLVYRWLVRLAFKLMFDGVTNIVNQKLSESPAVTKAAGLMNSIPKN